jgi:hypothetical protein
MNVVECSLRLAAQNKPLFHCRFDTKVLTRMQRSLADADLAAVRVRLVPFCAVLSRSVLPTMLASWCPGMLACCPSPPFWPSRRSSCFNHVDSHVLSRPFPSFISAFPSPHAPLLHPRLMSGALCSAVTAWPTSSLEAPRPAAGTTCGAPPSPPAW